MKLNLGCAGKRNKLQADAGIKVISEQLEAAKNNIIAFTDGSSLGNPGPTGCGAVIQLNESHSTPIKLAKAIHKNSNNFEGELQAIEMATDLIRKKMHKKNITIFSDCQSAIQSVASAKVQENYHQIVSNIHTNMRQIQTSNNVPINLNWVPGHCNTKQNEEADHHAKTGATLAKKINKSKDVTINEAKFHNRALSILIWNDRGQLTATNTSH